MSVHLIRFLFGHIGVLALVVAGLVLIVAGSSATGRRWAGRLVLLSVLLTVVAGFINQGWLP